MHSCYRPQWSWAKVIFSQASVCPRGEGCLPQCMLGYTPPGPGRPPPEQTPPEQTPQASHKSRDPPRPGTPPDQAPLLPPEQTPPLEQTPPPPPEADFSIRSTSGRYASYWNAFLLSRRLRFQFTPNVKYARSFNSSWNHQWKQHENLRCIKLFLRYFVKLFCPRMNLRLKCS